MSAAFAERRKALIEKLCGAQIDSLLITRPADWYYLTGFTGESGTLVVTRRGCTLVTDGRFAGQAKGEAPGVNVVLQKSSLFESTGKFIASQNNAVGFDPAQVSVAQFQTLRKAAGRGKRWKPVSGMAATLRTRKEPQELAVMRRAAILAGQVVEGVVGQLKTGVSELEIAAEIEFQMRRRGASGPAFESIVAFGERSALPHARPSAKRLKKNELVVLDVGAILAHYCSDITRTFYFGKAPKQIRMWYQSVQDAQIAAIAAVKNGACCGDVDAAARQVLARNGLDKYFVHSTGHGLGLEVHEEPRLARGQKQRLESGNVVTIEPGVYVDGVGGIRIEDDVAVHSNRTEVLTRISRDLIEI
jgi:Xaa-Pro aminopeptidase